MPERWTPEELKKYRQIIKKAPKSRAMEETRRVRKLNKLFNKILRIATHQNMMDLRQTLKG